jgi:N-methylhydantoinase A
LSGLLEDFHTAHERAYGFAAPGEPAQIVTLRLEARGAVATAESADIATAEAGTVPMQTGHRDVYIVECGGWLGCPIYERGGLLAGHQIEGPAIIEQMDATTLLLPGQWATVDRVGNLIVRECEVIPA